MKCKKPNCNGVVEIGVCTECGAESGAPVASKEKKSDSKSKDDKVKEQETVKSKLSAEAPHEIAGADEKAPTAAKVEPANTTGGKNKSASAKEQSSGKETGKKGGNEVARKENLSEGTPHKHKDLEKKVAERKEAEAKSNQPEAKKENEQRVLAQKESEHKAPEQKASEKKEPAGKAPEQEVPERKASEEKEPAGNAPEQNATEQKASGRKALEHKKSEQKEPAPEKPDAKPESESTGLAGLVAKRSPTEERKRIESTIPNSVVPAPAVEKLSFKDVNLEDTAAYRNIIETVRSMLEPREVAPSREDLYLASRALRHVMPYNFDAWRLHADLLLTAIHQLETRQLQPDPNFTLMAIPLREDDLRDAAEQALRECAHFADSERLKIELIDEANSVRRVTWF